MAEAEKQEDSGVVEVRETRREEKQAILDLTPDIYYGQDFLPSAFDQMDQDPKITGFGAYLDGKLVGYNVGHVLDGGRTLVLRAARVGAAHQGRGLYSRLSRDTVWRLRQRRPGLVREALTTNPLNMASNRASLLRRYSLVETRAVYWWTCKGDSLPAVASDDIISISTMDRDGLLDLFQRRPEAQTLFPSGRVIVSWIPYRIREESNFDERFFDSTLILHNQLLPSSEVTSLDDAKEDDSTAGDYPRSKHQRNMEEKELKEEEVGLISFGTWYLRPRRQGLSYIADCYGVDVDVLKQHVIAHLQRACRLAQEQSLPEDLTLTLCCDSSLAPDNVLPAFAEELGLQELEIPFPTMYHLEKEYDEVK